MGAGGHPLQIGVLRTTSGIFSVLGARPQLGRGFTPQEDKPGQERVVILMYGLWRTQFHSDPEHPGKDHHPRRISPHCYRRDAAIVSPAQFTDSVRSDRVCAISMDIAEALVPLAFTKDQLQEVAGDFNYPGLARLKPGISVAQAQAELNGLQHGISASLPADEKMTLSAILIPFQQYLVGNNSKPLIILLVAVAGLLFVGCINIMNLLLARAVGRRQEMAVASALGSQPKRPAASLHARGRRVGCDRRCIGNSARRDDCADRCSIFCLKS